MMLNRSRCQSREAMFDVIDSSALSPPGPRTGKVIPFRPTSKLAASRKNACAF
jgi:hypothetical protein